jgi:hypothetical protein
MESAIIQISAIGLALLSAVAAFWAAREARQSAIETRRATQAALISELLDSYASPEMLEAMILLRRFYEEDRGNFAERFRNLRSSDWLKVKDIDHSRRRVSHFFGKIYRLWAAGLIEEQLVRVVATEEQVQFFREVLEPLEAALSIDYDRRAFEQLGQLHGVRRYVTGMTNPAF